jgi:hypothetical protein
LLRFHSVRQQALWAAVAAMALGAILRFFPPSRYAFYPPCPFHTLLGILCPGCGVTRALAALLTGRWAEAARQNLLAVALAPALAIGGALELYTALRWNRWRKLPVSPFALKCLLTIAVIFGFARNMEALFRGFR